MAKTIKFNLICDNKPVRTIEDLQNNFSIEDILEYYNSKLLHRWLEVRGYAKELEKVNAIGTKEDIEIIKELIKIFAISYDDTKIDEGVYMLRYLNERKELCDIYNKENYKLKQIIDDYEMGYRELVLGIIENPYNIAKIKSNINEIVNNYAWIFQLNHRNLFNILKDKSVMAIMCLLMNTQTRKYYLPIEIKKDDGTVALDIASNTDKATMFHLICSMITAPYFADRLMDNLVSFAGVTDGYWKDLEPKGKKYMIISMGAGDFVRPAGLLGGDLACTDITNKFVIVDGIDYKSNYSTHQLLYMEV